MTMTVTEHQITTERKLHPNDGRYPCRTSQEVLNAGMKLLAILSLDQINQLKENNLVLDEEETSELFDEFKINDIIGVGIVRKNDYYLEPGFSAHKFEIIEILEKEDLLLCKNLRSEVEEEISFQDISVGFAMGFAEILYRDDKPFGISANQTITIKIHHDVPKEEIAKEEKSEPDEVSLSEAKLEKNDSATTSGLNEEDGEVLCDEERPTNNV